MLIARYLRHDRIRLEMHTQPLGAEVREALGDRALRVLKERILDEIADFLDQTARVGNKSKLYDDLVNRERKACTAVGAGLAIPHVRTANVKEPTVALLRSTPGLDFDAPDGEPVHVFLVLVAPPWDDKMYLRFYREAADLFLREDVRDWMLHAGSESDVFQFFRSPEKFVVDW